MLDFGQTWLEIPLLLVRWPNKSLVYCENKKHDCQPLQKKNECATVICNALQDIGEKT